MRVTRTCDMHRLPDGKINYHLESVEDEKEAAHAFLDGPEPDVLHHLTCMTLGCPDNPADMGAYLSAYARHIVAVRTGSQA